MRIAGRGLPCGVSVDHNRAGYCAEVVVFSLSRTSHAHAAEDAPHKLANMCFRELDGLCIRDAFMTKPLGPSACMSSDSGSLRRLHRQKSGCVCCVLRGHEIKNEVSIHIQPDYRT